VAVPFLLPFSLCGRWLADAGFAAGVEVQVEVGQEMLVIRPVASIKVPF